MAKSKKAVDSEVREDDVAMTTGNDGEVKVDEPEVDDMESQADDGPESDVGDDPEVKTKDEEIMDVGIDVPVVSSPMLGEGPSYHVVNRAAIMYLARMLMTPADIADFQKLFPSLFE